MLCAAHKQIVRVTHQEATIANQASYASEPLGSPHPPRRSIVWVASYQFPRAISYKLASC